LIQVGLTANPATLAHNPAKREQSPAKRDRWFKSTVVQALLPESKSLYFIFMSPASDPPHFVYVLWSETGRRFYIGISQNPEVREEQHNYRPWRIAFNPDSEVVTKGLRPREY
jgi:hypothetical protein